jgi:zinc transporter ZupT
MNKKLLKRDFTLIQISLYIFLWNPSIIYYFLNYFNIHKLKMYFNKFILVLLFLVLISNVNLHGSHGKKKDKKDKSKHGHGTHHGHHHKHNHDHAHEDHYQDHDHTQDSDHHEIPIEKINKSADTLQTTINNLISHYNRLLSHYLLEKLQNFSKIEQSYIGATITSLAPMPIYLLIILFNFKSIKILDIMSAFAAGALLGDVVLHNLPEIMEADDSNKTSTNSSSFTECLMCFLTKKEVLICLGVICLFTIEKIFSLINNEDSNEKTNKVGSGEKNTHGHSHGSQNETHKNTTKNVIVSFIGDTVHNITDGLAIGAAYSKSNIIINNKNRFEIRSCFNYLHICSRIAT